MNIRANTFNRLLGVGICVTAFASAGASLRAQSTPVPKSDTRGFTIGAHLVGTTLSAAHLSANNELGSGLMVGYGIVRWLSVFTAVDIGTGRIEAAPIGVIAECDCYSATNALAESPAPLQQPFTTGDYAYQNYDVGLRFTLPTSRAWAPFLNIAGSERRAQVQRTSTYVATKSDLRGRATTIGAGIQYFVDRRWAFEGSAQYSKGKFNRQRESGFNRLYNVEPTQTVRFTGGLRLYPHLWR